MASPKAPALKTPPERTGKGSSERIRAWRSMPRRLSMLCLAQRSCFWLESQVQRSKNYRTSGHQAITAICLWPRLACGVAGGRLGKDCSASHFGPDRSTVFRAAVAMPNLSTLRNGFMPHHAGTKTVLAKLCQSEQRCMKKQHPTVPSLSACEPPRHSRHDTL